MVTDGLTEGVSLIYAMVDSLQMIPEAVETNNIAGPLMVTATVPLTASLQVVHLAPFASGAAAVDVYVNGSMILADVAYNHSSGYLVVPTGEHLVELKPAGTATTAVSATISLDAGMSYSAIAHGGANGYPLVLLLLSDDVVVLRTGSGPMGSVRVGHLAPFDADLGNTAVFIIDDTTGLALIPVPVTYGTISPFIALPTGEYDLSVQIGF